MRCWADAEAYAGEYGPSRTLKSGGRRPCHATPNTAPDGAVYSRTVTPLVVTNCLTLNDEDCSTSALPGSDIWPFNAAASDSTEVPSPLSPARVATGASVNKHPPIKAASTNFPALMLMSLGTSDRHEYVLTEKGLDLFPVIVVLSQWGSRRFPGLHEPRLILLIPPRKFCAMKTPE
jgi:hypothetical protein